MNADPTKWESAVCSLRAGSSGDGLITSAYMDPDVVTAACRFAESEEWQETVRWLPLGGAAVDLAAGRGIASYALAKAGWEVTAVEPDSGDHVGRGAITELVRRCQLSIEIMNGTAEALPLASSSVDLVYMRAGLHHVTSLSAVCCEIFRVLKPSGRFMAVREHVVSSEAQRKAFLDGHPLHHAYGGENAFRKGEYIKAIRDAGFCLRAVLGSHESCINYAPYTRMDHHAVVSAWVRRGIGWRLTQAIIDERRRAGRIILRFLEGMASALDRRPGRLMSFVADKP